MTEQFSRCRGSLITQRTVKERPQNSFLTNLFSGRNESVDRDELFAGSGKGSSQVATHIPGQLSLSAQINDSSKKLEQNAPSLSNIDKINTNFRRILGTEKKRS